MRKIVVTEFVSLDGVMEDPGGSEKSQHGGWTMPYWGDEIAQFKSEEFYASDAQLLGRVTYQAFALAWPSRTDEGEFGERMNNMVKYVVSQTLQDGQASWNNSRVIRGNVVEEISRLKQQPGENILVAGSARLVHTLIQNRLVDEFRLLVYPVLLGSGKRLFADASRLNLKLLEAKSFPSGVVGLVYQATA